MGQYWGRNADDNLRVTNQELLINWIWRNRLLRPLKHLSLFKLIERKTYAICDHQEIKGRNLNELMYKTITGKQLKEIIGSMPLLKFMNDDDQHFGMTYHTGINEDCLMFENKSNCSRGGIYVTTLENYESYYTTYGKYARRVDIEDDALIYVEDRKLKCSKVILGERKLKKELLEELVKEYVENKDDEFIIRLITGNPELCSAITNKLTEKIIIEAMEQNIGVFNHINRTLMTPKIIMKAIKMNGLLIQYVDENQITYEMIMEAIKQCIRAIRYIARSQLTSEIMEAAIDLSKGHVIGYLDEDQRTPELIMKAIKLDGRIIQYIDEKTHEMIMEAIKQNGLAIKYVDKTQRTPDMIITAIKQNDRAINSISQDEIVGLLHHLIEKIESKTIETM